jgi:hypothetical protein
MYIGGIQLIVKKLQNFRINGQVLFKGEKITKNAKMGCAHLKNLSSGTIGPEKLRFT